MEQRSLKELRDRLVSLRVREEDTLAQVVAKVLDQPGHSEICVVDGGGKLLGVIRIKTLFRTLFFHHAEPTLMTRQLLELASPETAGHLMVTDPAVAREDDTLDDAIRTMVQRRLGELPVVDAQRRLLGSVAMKHVFALWLERQRGQGEGQG